MIWRENIIYYHIAIQKIEQHILSTRTIFIKLNDHYHIRSKA